MAAPYTDSRSPLDAEEHSPNSRSNSSGSSASQQDSRPSGQSGGLGHGDSTEYHSIESPADSSPVEDAAAAAAAAGTERLYVLRSPSSSSSPAPHELPRQATSSVDLGRRGPVVSAPSTRQPPLPPRWRPASDAPFSSTAAPRWTSHSRASAGTPGGVGRPTEMAPTLCLFAHARGGGTPSMNCNAAHADPTTAAWTDVHRRGAPDACLQCSFPEEHQLSYLPSADAADSGRCCYYKPVRLTEPVCTASTASASEWVLLNVGGRLITTTVATLTSDPNSMLGSLCACLAHPSPSQHREAVAVPTASSRQGAAGVMGGFSQRVTDVRDDRAASAVAASEGDGGVPQGDGVPHADGRYGPPATAVPRTMMGEGDAGGVAENEARLAEQADLVEVSESGGDEAQTQTEGVRFLNSPGYALRPPSSMTNVGVPQARDEDGAPRDGDQSSPSAYLLNCFSSPDHGTSVRESLSAPSRQGRIPLHEAATSSPARASRCTLVPKSPMPSSSSVRHGCGGGGSGGGIIGAGGEAVSPQNASSAIPLDTDGASAILLDLDADYFLPVLNYLRHGAVMIPPHVSRAGVLAMAEYLNVEGLARKLRPPSVPRRVLLFSWGSGANGELGTHATRDEPTPTMAQVAPFGVRVVEIALGANYSCALTDRGHVYAFGNGEWGQLGLGSSGYVVRGASAASNSSSMGLARAGGTGLPEGADVPVEFLIPRRIPLFERLPAVHVAAGYAFAMAIVAGHRVYFWGNNNHGQSGRGRRYFNMDTKKVDSPVLVETLEGYGIVQLSCGSFFALALSENGSLYSWGLVDCVGLGSPEEVERRYRDVLGESLSNERRSVVLTPQLVTVEGRRRAMAAAAAGGPATSERERIVRIRAGQWHSGAINEHGELFTWGVGYQGRLGHGTKTPMYVPTLVRGALEDHRVVDVACGSFHTVALTQTGVVFCWGDNASGQCGTSAGVPDAFTAPYRVIGLEYVAGGVARGIACGRQHTVVVMEGPQPWCSLPCCRGDSTGVGHRSSHAQVYCFGEAARTGNTTGQASTAATATAAAAAAAAASNAGRGPTATSPFSTSAPSLSVNALPASPQAGPLAPGSVNVVFPHAQGFNATTAAFAGFQARSPLPCTGGHHHPHYQLVPGLHCVDVRGVVSGLHHTFAYVEELRGDRDDTLEPLYEIPLPTSLSGAPLASLPGPGGYYNSSLPLPPLLMPSNAVARSYSPDFLQRLPLEREYARGGGGVWAGTGGDVGVTPPGASRPPPGPATPPPRASWSPAQMESHPQQLQPSRGNTRARER